LQQDDDDMSLKEIARTLADFRQEFRSQISQLLRADVYRAEKAALEVRLSSLEKDRDSAEQQAAATRKLALGAVLTCVGTILAALVMIAITR
jgi:hypothetical protein